MHRPAPNPHKLLFAGLTALTAVVFTAGCNTGPAEGGGWQFEEPDTDQTDTAPQNDALNDTADVATGPVQHTFKIVNTGDEPVAYYRKSTCNPDSLEWLNLGIRDSTVKMNNTCDVCACSDVGQCTDCPASGPCPPPTTRTLMPGQSHYIPWNGEAWVPDQVDSTACHRPEVPGIGTEMDAEFTWFRPGGAPDVDKRSRVISFEYGTQTDITAEISLSPEPSPTTIRLTNESGSNIWIQGRTACTGPTPLWLEMLNNDGTRAPVGVGCDQCKCSTLKNNSDDCRRICPAACVPPMWQKLADGRSTRWRWSGYTYTESSVDGETCQQRRVPELGDTFRVRFCWANDSNGNDRLCDTRRFNYGVTSAVEHTVE